jgi:serpin B
MLTRRETLRILGAAGLVAPALTACGADDAGPRADPVGMRLVDAAAARGPGDVRAVPGVVSAMGGLTDDLWGHLAPANQNLVLSPFSIAVALAMTANGAAGETRAQMLDVLHADSLPSYNLGTAALTRSLEALAGPVVLNDGTKGEIDLVSADQLFGDASEEFGRPFLTVLAQQYGAGMRTVDFAHDVEAARTLINAWTADRTHDRIPAILPPGSVDPTTRLVLVDALFFKAPWAEAFEKAATTRQAFQRADGSRADVAMMHTSARAATYLARPHLRAARLPYAGGALAMTVALPDQGHEHEALAALTGGLLTSPGEPGVALSMPRWTFRTPSPLRQVLIDLGMGLAFGDRADFTPMAPHDRLAIHDVLHQAFVAVDEVGTEAAAATAVVMDEVSGVVTPHTLALDRPFLFAVHDVAHGTPLFVGRVADPS